MLLLTGELIKVLYFPRVIHRWNVLFSWLIPVCIAATAIAIVGVATAVKKVASLLATASSTVSSVIAKVKGGGLDPENLRNETVYAIARKNTTDVVYVGRTKNYAARYSTHQKRFPKAKYTMIPIATGLTLKESRTLEQTIIMAYGIETLKNMINSISPPKMEQF